MPINVHMDYKVTNERYCLKSSAAHYEFCLSNLPRIYITSARGMFTSVGETLFHCL